MSQSIPGAGRVPVEDENAAMADPVDVHMDDHVDFTDRDFKRRARGIVREPSIDEDDGPGHGELASR